MENRPTTKKKVRLVLLILLTGLICPFAARIPGSFLYGIDFLLAYAPSAKAVLFLSVFNIIPFAVLALIAKVKYDSNKPGVIGAGIIVYGLTLFGHGTLDLSSSSTAGIAIVFIPIWITVLAPFGYILSALVGRVWNCFMDVDTRQNRATDKLLNKMVAAGVIAVSGLYTYLEIWGVNIFYNFIISAESFSRVGFSAAVLIMTIAGAGLFFEKKWGYYVSFFGSSMLACHLLFTFVQYLSFEIKVFTPAVFIDALTMHAPDFMALLLFYHLTTPEVKKLFGVHPGGVPMRGVIAASFALFAATSLTSLYKYSAVGNQPIVVKGGCFDMGKSDHVPHPSTAPGMVFVKGGCFDMGDTFRDGRNEEKPVHRVCLDDFYMDKCEVTNRDFERFKPGFSESRNDTWMSKQVSPGDNNPVLEVTWKEADAYCKSLEKRLPTEAQWEYAAREGGKKVRYGTGKNSISCLEAKHGIVRMECSGAASTVPVGSYSPNSLGLYDMSGNVNEWVNDWYDKDYYGASPESNPQGPSSGKYRIQRGGGWYSGAWYLRAVFRGRSRLRSGGFRCAQ